jgi:quinol monooxygenase YgiN
VTHVDVPGGQREAAEKLLHPLAEAMRRVPGHLRYEVYQQDEPHTNHFTVVAGWKDRAAFEVWDDSAPWRQFMEALAPLLGAPYDERLYRRIER